MNKQILRLFGLTVVLFGVLIAFTSRWMVFEAESLEDRTANRRPLLEEQKIPRGLILARDGSTLAQNRKLGSGSSLRYVREYPTDDLFAHAVGYSYIERGRSATERFYNDELTGNRNEFNSIIDELQGKIRSGDDVRTTLDPQAQQLALRALQGRKGAVVALEPETGRVRVMASVPTFDPNLIPKDFNALNRDPDSPLLNRVTQGQYPPGSTMKVVTAAAALDSGKFNPDSVLDGASPKTIGGAPLSNFGGQSFGTVTLTAALTNSVNTVWAQVGEQLGRETMLDYMKKFGFYEDLPLDYPPSEMFASGVFVDGDLVEADAGFDIGRVSIGQSGAEGEILVTPLQAAMVAATVGNDGILMKPRLVERVVAKDGRVQDDGDPQKQRRVIKEETAKQLAAMMAQVVREGSGTAAALQGVEVAGKTGTAEYPDSTENRVWFIGFAPVNDPKIAVAVTIERAPGTGGEVAAPIAKQVIEALIE